jgi:hypothetical protein
MPRPLNVNVRILGHYGLLPCEPGPISDAESSAVSSTGKFAAGCAVLALPPPIRAKNLLLPILETVFIGVAFMEVLVILVAIAMDLVPVVSHELFFSFLVSG